MIKLKDLGIGFSIPLIIFSFAYFDVFFLPFFPSLWQLGKFFAKALADQYSVLLFSFATICLVISSFKVMSSKMIAWLLVLCFIMGMLIANDIFRENFSKSFNVILFTLFFLGIVIAVSATVEQNYKPIFFIPTAIVLTFLFWQVSVSMITDYMNFPRFGDYQILVWSDENKDYVITCGDIPGSLFEVAYDNEGNKKFTERRVNYSNDLQRMCERLFSSK